MNNIEEWISSVEDVSVEILHNMCKDGLLDIKALSSNICTRNKEENLNAKKRRYYLLVLIKCY